MLGESEVTSFNESKTNFEHGSLLSVILTLFSCTIVPSCGSVQVTLYVAILQKSASALSNKKSLSNEVSYSKLSPNLYTSSISVRLSGDRLIPSFGQSTIVTVKVFVKATL